MVEAPVTDEGDLVCLDCGEQLEVLVPPGGDSSEVETFCVNPFCAETDPNPDPDLGPEP
ncbi:MAG: hypothetical protein ACXV5Q_08555 [Frankiaceae bacterium]